LSLINQAFQILQVTTVKGSTSDAPLKKQMTADLTDLHKIKDNN
jgi:hypothetical protein